MLRRAFWFSLGALALFLAIAGAILPLLPTTPFLLLAAYGFARSSRRVHDWLLAHPYFGRLIRNWREHGSIDRKSKVHAILAMLAALLITYLIGAGLRILVIQGVVMIAVATFILSRPDTPSDVDSQG